MLKLNINYIASLYAQLGFPTVASFLADWGRDKSVLYRLYNKDNVRISNILELCNRYGLNPSSFFIDDELPNVNAFPAADGWKGSFAFSPQSFVTTPKLGNVRWLSALACLPYSYGKKIRMLNQDPSANRMEAKDVIAICEYTGLTPSDFFLSETTATQKSLLEQIDQLQEQLNNLRKICG